MDEFIYLYRGRTQPPGSPQQMQDVMQRWQAWFKDLEEKGNLANFGQPLAPSGGAVVRDQRGNVSDGPYAETKDIVMGFSVIRAKDLKEAIALAKGCPVFEQGGLVEVRPIPKL